MQKIVESVLSGKRLLILRDIKAIVLGVLGMPSMLSNRKSLRNCKGTSKEVVLLSIGGRYGSPMLAQELHRQGYYVHVVSSRLPGHELPYCTQWHRYDCLSNYDQLLELSRTLGVSSVFSEIRNVLLPIKAKLISDLGLREFGELSAKTSTSKFAFRKALDSGGVRNLKWHPLDEFESSDMVPPYVIKPDMGSGSRGVYFIESEEDLHQAKIEIEAAANADIIGSHFVGGRMIVEKFIQGRQFDVEGVSRDGFCHPLSLTEEHYDNVGFSFPSSWYLFSPPIERKLRENLLEVATQAVKASGVMNGSWHCEMRVANDGTIYPLDYSNRMGYPKMVSEASGENFFAQYIATMIDQEFTPPSPRYNTVFQRFIEDAEERKAYLRLADRYSDSIIEFRKQGTTLAGVERFGRVSIRADSFSSLKAMLDEFQLTPQRWSQYYDIAFLNSDDQPKNLYSNIACAR